MPPVRKVWRTPQVAVLTTVTLAASGGSTVFDDGTSAFTSGIPGG